jgi:hypothetical protein
MLQSTYTINRFVWLIRLVLSKIVFVLWLDKRRKLKENRKVLLSIRSCDVRSDYRYGLDYRYHNFSNRSILSDYLEKPAIQLSYCVCWNHSFPVPLEIGLQIIHQCDTINNLYWERCFILNKSPLLGI